MSGPTVQMNTRIPIDLKQRGDYVLDRAGLTPSEAVRALWEFASSHADDPAAVRALVGADSRDASSQRIGKQDALHAGWAILENCGAVEAYGSYDEVLFAAYASRFELEASQ